jgi:hypothetical protein
MTPLITFLTALSAFIAATVTLIKTLQNGRKIQEIHVSINSRMTQLLDLVAKSSKAEGVKQEVDRPK